MVGFELGNFPLDATRHGQAIGVSFALPASPGQSPFLAASRESSDGAYTDSASGRYASFQLKPIELK